MVLISFLVGRLGGFELRGHSIGITRAFATQVPVMEYPPRFGSSRCIFQSSKNTEMETDISIIHPWVLVRRGPAMCE